MNTLLFVDCETGGLDPTKDPLLEIGTVRWSIEHRCVLSAWSTLVQGSANDAESVNHIPTAALAGAAPAARVFDLFRQIADKSDVLVAHNCEFDRAFLPAVDKPWVCSKFDLKWPNVEVDGESLVKICVANDVPVVSAHRALTDCMLLAKLFERVAERGHDVRSLIQYGLRPKAEFLSLAPFEQKDVVKSHGFKWHPDEKEWRRRMAIEDAEALPFKTKRLNS